MKKIYTIIVLLGAIVLGSCSDFLDETTDKSGSAYIYHMDQLYGLTGRPIFICFLMSVMGKGFLVQPI